MLIYGYDRKSPALAGQWEIKRTMLYQMGLSSVFKLKLFSVYFIHFTSKDVHYTPASLKLYTSHGGTTNPPERTFFRSSDHVRIYDLNENCNRNQ